MITNYLCQDNPRANYMTTTLTPDDDIDLYKEANQEYTPIEKVDYYIDGDVNTTPKMPLSFSKIKTIEQGIEFYSRNHPELNDDIIVMIARSQFGNLPIKNARISKGKENNKLKVEPKETTIFFN
tara:strand:- start:316 stop:690 length:375 start_codon:yes stop_codon:yes gene_type:complete